MFLQNIEAGVAVCASFSTIISDWACFTASAFVLQLFDYLLTGSGVQEERIFLDEVYCNQ